MTQKPLSEIVGQKGLATLFEVMDRWDVTFPSGDVLDTMDSLEIRDSDVVFDRLIQEGLLRRAGGDLVSLTTNGTKTHLLLQAINGSDLQMIYQRLTALYPSWARYQVVRDRMTQDFIRELYEQPDFRRLYLCSRWINLGKTPRGRLATAVHRASDLHDVEIIVIHGPLSPKPDRDVQLKDTLRFLRALGAETVLNRKVHAKLYIREPGASGGVRSAVVGSENLTIPKYAELGLKIVNDRALIDNLIAEFYEIYAGNTYQGV